MPIVSADVSVNAADPPTPTALPRALLRRFLALGDPTIRRKAVRDTIAGLDAASIKHLLTHLIDRRTDPDVRPVWLDAALALLDDALLPADVRADLCARVADVPVLRVAGGIPSPAAGPAPTPTYDLEDVPLGWRKARARRRDRDTLNRLADAPDQEVLRILLDNPVVTESNAIRVATRRFQSPEGFRVVLSSRFGTREQVMAAVVENPACPVRLALAVLPMLARPRRAEVATSPRLDGLVR